MVPVTRRVHSVERAGQGKVPGSVRVWLHYDRGTAACVEVTQADLSLARSRGSITPVGAEPVEVSWPMLDEIERLLRSAA